MLRNVKELIGYRLLAKDDMLGKVKDFLFDDIVWNVRYLVADTGGWMHDRRVLISPASFGVPNWGGKMLPVHLTKSEIENSPGISEDMPVSVEIERQLANYYNWPYYWSYPGSVPFYDVDESSIKVEEIEQTSHLRSAGEVLGYHIHAKKGEIGHVEDFILEDDTWIIRYMIVDTRNWLPGRKVLISPQWIKQIDWKNKNVHTVLMREIIENGPEYDAQYPVSREFENQLFELYGADKYWE